MRRLLSRLSMVVGAILFVAGLAMRGGVFGPARAAVPTAAPSAAVVALATPTAKAATPTPTLAPTSSPTLAPTSPPPVPTPSASDLLFADAFSTEAAWATGKVTGGKARYAGGWYVVELVPIDLPGYLTPAAGDGPLPGAITVDVTMTVGGADAKAGPFVADATGTRIGVLLSADGRVTIVRDSLESFDVLGTGWTTAPTGPVRLTLVLRPDGTLALVDGHPVATIRERLVPASFGLAIWAQTARGTVRVDRFEVRA
jgi:hypothetical protein